MTSNMHVWGLYACMMHAWWIHGTGCLQRPMTRGMSSSLAKLIPWGMSARLVMVIYQQVNQTGTCADYIWEAIQRWEWNIGRLSWHGQAVSPSWIAWMDRQGKRFPWGQIWMSLQALLELQSSPCGSWIWYRNPYLFMILITAPHEFKNNNLDWWMNSWLKETPADISCAASFTLGQKEGRGLFLVFHFVKGFKMNDFNYKIIKEREDYKRIIIIITSNSLNNGFFLDKFSAVTAIES